MVLVPLQDKQDTTSTWLIKSGSSYLRMRTKKQKKTKKHSSAKMPWCEIPPPPPLPFLDYSSSLFTYILWWGEGGGEKRMPRSRQGKIICRWQKVMVYEKHKAKNTKTRRTRIKGIAVRKRAEVPSKWRGIVGLGFSCHLGFLGVH